MRTHPLQPLIAGLIRLITGVGAQWTEPLAADRQRIYYANHTSHLDTAVIWASLPPELRAAARPVAAADYWSAGFRRYLARNVFNAVLVERNASDLHASRDTFDNLVHEMSDKYSLILFPEGTRGTGEQIAPFKSGIFHLCERKPDVELVPVYIDNMHRVLPKGELLPVPLMTRVVFGAPMRLQDGEHRREFLQRMQHLVANLKES